MKVILLKSVPKIGNKYQVINVADGFAMNSLFPKGLAEVATPKAIARIQEFKSQEEAERKVREDLLLKNLKEVSGITVEYAGKANEKGHLFAGIHKDEIIKALKEQDRLDLTAEYIVLDKPIKEVGEHKIPVLVQGTTAEFTLIVKAL
jgi:large subunit ribosomal protein L9